MAITKATASAVAPAAKGDLVVGSATNDAAVLGVGSADQVLTVDSSTTTGLKWATPSAGSMTLISTTTLSSSSITLSSIPSTYKDLKIVIRNFLPATDDSAIRLRFNGDANNNRYQTVNANAANSSISQNSGLIASSSDNSVGNGLITIDIPDYTNTSTWKIGICEAVCMNPTTTTNQNVYRNFITFNQTGAITSIGLGATNPNTTGEYGSGNFTSGTVLFYGVN